MLVVFTDGVSFILGRRSGLQVSIRTVDAGRHGLYDPSADVDCENLTLRYETNRFPSFKQ